MAGGMDRSGAARPTLVERGILRPVPGSAPVPEGGFGPRPVGLTGDQLGPGPVTRAPRGIPVLAWVPWTDGRYHRVAAYAGEWTPTAVHLRWRESTGVERDIWTWAAAVRRRGPGRSSSGPAR